MPLLVGFMGLFVMFACIILPIYAVKITFCVFVSKILHQVPHEYRKQSPGLTWLLLIPFFDKIWNFFVYPPTAKSYQNYFSANNVHDTGDCGAGLALAICLTDLAAFLFAIIPAMQAMFILFALTSLILELIFIIKLWALRSRIIHATALPITQAVAVKHTSPLAP